ncbi:CWC16 protein [Podospora didyma]|uniref:CWC16 protein n=1 Tax=Podospora didyma TaxID=330526 RepID=A0AAE0NHE0_9PEZI|nr:CWC16 protein [Podospora didyma]
MQGFNMGKYVPPDQEGVLSGNALNKKHALGARASKLASQGILTVRFEMPFAVWCGHCPRPTVIGQGVRFNAEKKRVGSYFSTPVWSFRMRHAACGGEIEIRTDPQHTAYVVAAGGKKRDTGDDADDSLVKSGEYLITTEREKAEQRESAFGTLERTIADRERLEDARHRIGELHDAAERQWEDPYAQNQRLRRAFRVGRHGREKEAASTEELRDRMSLGIELLPGTADDARWAALIDFGGVPDAESDAPVVKALARPLFETKTPKLPHKTSTIKLDSSTTPPPPTTTTKAAPPKKLKAEIAASKMRDTLVSEIVGNTRAAMDPFLDFGNGTNSTGSKDAPPRGPVRLPGLKRKRATEEPPGPPEPPPPLSPPAAEKEVHPKAIADSSATTTSTTTMTTISPLVNYCSDSE